MLFRSAASTTAVEATAAAVAGFEVMRRLSAYARAEILRKAAYWIAQHREEFARVITGDNGKPIRQSRTEVDRAVHTMTAAAEEATRIHGETIPLDVRRGTEGRFGVVRRFPIGPVLGIAPFNYPLNLVAHKVAPALAAGCSIVLKPASRTPPKSPRTSPPSRRRSRQPRSQLARGPCGARGHADHRQRPGDVEPGHRTAPRHLAGAPPARRRMTGG